MNPFNGAASTTEVESIVENSRCGHPIEVFSNQQHKPSWTSYRHRKEFYPINNYFIGFATLYFHKGDDLNTIQDALSSKSKSLLIESIHIKISSVATSTLKNTNGLSEEIYNKDVIVSSKLEASGVKTEIYLDHKKQIGYAFSFIKKKDFNQSLKKQVKILTSQLSGQIDWLQKNISSNLFNESLHEASEALSNLVSTNSILSNELSSEMVSRINKFKRQITELKANSDQRSLHIKEVANTINYHFKEYLNTSVPKVIYPITYKSTGVASELSHFLKDKLSVFVNNIDFLGAQEDTSMVLTGNYWPNDSGITINVSLTKVYLGLNIVKLKSISFHVEKPNDLNYLPNIKSLKEGIHKEVNHPTLLVDEGMSIDLMTRKGNGAISYKTGEKMKLMVKSSLPAYIRIINVWYDGRKSLLVDNFKINSSNANRTIELPFEWITTCPCGVEYIYAYAQSEPFERLNTIPFGKFTMVDETFRSVVQKTRSLKSSRPELLEYAENKLTITTLP